MDKIIIEVDKKYICAKKYLFHTNSLALLNKFTMCGIMEKEITDNFGRRVGNLDDLPDELKSQLQIAKSDELESHILNSLSRLSGIANLDELLVDLYRTTNIVHKRQFISNKLYRMSKMDRVISVPKKKGAYKLP